MKNPIFPKDNTETQPGRTMYANFLKEAQEGIDEPCLQAPAKEAGT